MKLSSNGWQGENEGKVEIQKFEYLENKKSFLDEIKNIFRTQALSKLITFYSH